MSRTEFDDRWIGYQAWTRLPISYSQWWDLPDLAWMRATLPWEVGWARMTDSHGLMMGGIDAVVGDWPWLMSMQSPWALWEDEYAFISWQDERDYPRVVECINRLVAQRVVEILSQPGQENELVFVFSNGYRLVLPFVETDCVDLFRLHIWGATLRFGGRQPRLVPKSERVS